MQGQQNEDQPNGAISSVMRDYVNMLVSTSAMLDEDLLEDAVTCLQQAEKFSF